MSPSTPSIPARPAGVVFTDLDGTLLDHTSYRPSKDAAALLGRLSRKGIVVVPVTSKTAAEVRPLAAELSLVPLAVVEGGAEILGLRGEEGPEGVSRLELVAGLETLKRAGLPLKGMSEMSPEEVSGLTGLDLAAAALAMTRSASEPFITLHDLEPGDEAEMIELARAAGVEIARGGRFWHVHPPGIDKGAAVRRILDELFFDRRIRSGAVGDAWNDLPMLAEVERGFLLGHAVVENLVPPEVIRISTPGPAGFVEAVDLLLEFWGVRLEE